MSCERPILFSAPMVRALLAGAKSQTRRIVKPQPDGVYDDGSVRYDLSRLSATAMRDRRRMVTKLCPYGAAGDRLYVKETHQYADWTEDGIPCIAYKAGGDSKWCHRIGSDQWADRLVDIWAGLSLPANYDIDGRAADRRWRPAIHMPRWASRITLEITGVRVERLQDITEDDALAEGVAPAFEDDNGIVGAQPAYRYGYAKLWDDINGAGSWDANPWVWVVEFKRSQP